jgi:predicted phage-related endonuclease
MSIEEKIRKYKEARHMEAQAREYADAIADEIKSEMQAEGREKWYIGEYKITYTDCERRDIDKKRLEAEQAEIYAEYLKITSYKRFAIA